jgi:heme o synthase
MKTLAISATHLQSSSHSRPMARLPDCVGLMKLRLMGHAVFTALVGVIIALGHLKARLGVVAILAIAAGAGSGGAFNTWYGADIDAEMARSARRPIPRGTISRVEALAFGLVLADGTVTTFGVALNSAAAALLTFTSFFYVVVYTICVATFGDLAMMFERLAEHFARAEARLTVIAPNALDNWAE